MIEVQIPTIAESIQIIHNAERDIVINFYRIGTSLSTLRRIAASAVAYEELVQKEFTFTVSTANRMIQVVKNYSEDRALEYGFTKCIELLRLGDQHDTFVETFPVQDHSVRQLKEKIDTFKQINREKPIKKIDPKKEGVDKRFIQFEVEMKTLTKRIDETVPLIDDFCYTCDGIFIKYEAELKAYERKDKIDKDMRELWQSLKDLKKKLDHHLTKEGKNE